MSFLAAIACWTAGAVEGFGIGVAMHADPYVALALVFGGMLLTGAAFAVVYERWLRPSGRRPVLALKELEDFGIAVKRPDAPRRLSVPGRLNANIYRRADGKYEVGWRDTNGKQRWQSPFETLEQARVWRSAMLARREDVLQGRAAPDGD